MTRDTFRCTGRKGMRPAYWYGEIVRTRSKDDMHELQVNARSSYFHIIIGKHQFGSYICVPNWGIGTEIAELTDRDWNLNQLIRTYPKISKVDLISIVDAVCSYGYSIQEYPF